GVEADPGGRAHVVSMLESAPALEGSNVRELAGVGWAAPIVPRGVKRAIAYMQAHLGEPITIAQIVQASGTARRTLFKHFQDFRGVSPMEYLRNARFERVRQALMRGDRRQSVTAIAMAWGFGHLGRFAVDYRRRFGESPSQTRRRILSGGADF